VRILFLSFYFSPDLCAGSFRNSALLPHLLEALPSDSHVDVMTTLPNRYTTYSAAAQQEEMFENYSVYRIELPSHQSGMLDQALAFTKYAAEVLKFCRDKEYDLVYASSSRLMTATLGAWVSKRLKAPLYLDIRDIFVDTIKDVLSRKIVWAMKPVFSLIEKWTMGQARKINLVSGGFKYYFEERYPSKALSYFTNGIDEEFMNLDSLEGDSIDNELVEVLYAGNLGEGQGLHSIIPALAKYFDGRLKFKIYGDGGRKAQLIELLEEKNISNVTVMPPVSRAELISAYRQADVLFMHLNDYDAFLKVLPSKVFEYAALGKPIWAGVTGFSATFIHDNISNAAVFSPCDTEQAVAAFETLDLRTEKRDMFLQLYSREKIMKKMACDILSILDSK